jgi:hypothetical protein
MKRVPEMDIFSDVIVLNCKVVTLESSGANESELMIFIYCVNIRTTKSGGGGGSEI